jgi:hypothetical protein
MRLLAFIGFATCSGFVVNVLTMWAPHPAAHTTALQLHRDAMFRSGASVLSGDNEDPRRAFPADERIRHDQE